MAEAGAALAKDRAVEPLLQALEEPANTAARPAVNVLVSLTRVEDDRIAAVVTHVGADYWSVEYRMPFNDERPQASSGLGLGIQHGAGLPGRRVQPLGAHLQRRPQP